MPTPSLLGYGTTNIFSYQTSLVDMGFLQTWSMNFPTDASFYSTKNYYIFKFPTDCRSVLKLAHILMETHSFSFRNSSTTAPIKNYHCTSFCYNWPIFSLQKFMIFLSKFWIKASLSTFFYLMVVSGLKPYSMCLWCLKIITKAWTLHHKIWSSPKCSLLPIYLGTFCLYLHAMTIYILLSALQKCWQMGFFHQPIKD
jgi:hypothetical protein